MDKRKENFAKIQAFMCDKIGSALMYENDYELLHIFEELELSDIERSYFEGIRSEDGYGGEGQGENYYTVYYFPALDIYVKFYGWYQSYNGAEYLGFELVEPIERMVTFYEPIK